MARRRITCRSTAALALSAAVGMLGCGGNPGAQGGRSAVATAAAEHAATLPVPKPILGGDFFPDSPHHKAGIFHQFYPIDVSLLGDGPWAEPNEITDFDGLVAQVFQGGAAVDNAGTAYNVDADTRVYVGEYVGTNGERAFGAFCTI